MKKWPFISRKFLASASTYLANQVSADLLLYLFSSVSSLVTFIVEELIEELTNNGDVTDDAIDPLYPGSLFKLPRFVARGLQRKWFWLQDSTHFDMIFKINTLSNIKKKQVPVLNTQIPPNLHSYSNWNYGSFWFAIKI